MPDYSAAECLEIAGELRSAGRFAAAGAILQFAQSSLSGTPNANTFLAHAYMAHGVACYEAGRFDNAANALTQALFFSPDLAPAKNMLAMSQFQIAIRLSNGGRYLAAASYLRGALALRPDFSEAMDGLAVTLFALATPLVNENRFDDAEPILREILALRPGHQAATQTLARVLYQRGVNEYYDADPATSHATLSEAARWRPDMAEIHQALSVVGPHRAAWMQVVPANHMHRQTILAAKDARGRMVRNRRQIVLVSESLRTRLLSLARGLTKAGLEVVLLYRNEPNFSLAGICSSAVRFTDCWDALAKAAAMQPLVFHLSSSFIDSTMVLFTRYKPGPVIFDYQDIFPGLIPGNTFNSKGFMGKWQTEVLTDADGLCCQDLQYRAAARINGWRRNRNVIWFPHYPEDYHLPVERPGDKTLRMVSTGYIEDPDGTLSMAETFFGSLVKAGIALDIYPHPSKALLSPEKREAYFNSLLAMGTDKTPVILRDFVDPDTLIERERNSDIGTILRTSTLKDGEEPFYSKAYLDNGLSGRVCEFLRAGIVILGMSDLRMSRFISRRYGRQMDVDGPLSTQQTQELHKLVAASKKTSKIKSSFILSTNIPRLIVFYEKICHTVYENLTETSTML